MRQKLAITAKGLTGLTAAGLPPAAHDATPYARDRRPGGKGCATDPRLSPARADRESSVLERFRDGIEDAA